MGTAARLFLCHDRFVIELIGGGTMNRLYVATLSFFVLAACTTTGPESRPPAATAEASVIASNPTEAEGVTEQSAAPEVSKVAATEDKDEVICTREKLTGSRIKTTVCMTREEREKLQQLSEDNMKAITTPR
jgi:predicted small lipoprotein YifL